jgi:hypothetical protein
MSGNNRYYGALPTGTYYYWYLHTCEDGLDIHEFVWDAITGKFLYEYVSGIQPGSVTLIKLNADIHRFIYRGHEKKIPPTNYYDLRFKYMGLDELSNAAKFSYAVEPIHNRHISELSR